MWRGSCGQQRDTQPPLRLTRNFEYTPHTVLLTAPTSPSVIQPFCFCSFKWFTWTWVFLSNLKVFIHLALYFPIVFWKLWYSCFSYFRKKLLKNVKLRAKLPELCSELPYNFYLDSVCTLLFSLLDTHTCTHIILLITIIAERSESQRVGYKLCGARFSVLSMYLPRTGTFSYRTAQYNYQVEEL